MRSVSGLAGILTHLPLNESGVFVRHHLFSSSRLSRIFLSIVVLSALVLVPLGVHAEGEREVIARVKPVYPEIAKRMKITGTVLLNVVVAKDGSVKSASTIMGENALAAAAKDAVMKWKFAPGDYETTEEIEIKFAL